MIFPRSILLPHRRHSVANERTRAELGIDVRQREWLRKLDAAVDIIETGFADAIAKRRAERLKNRRILTIGITASLMRDWPI